jgi:hypothetical protein
MEEAEDVHL